MNNQNPFNPIQPINQQPQQQHFAHPQMPVIQPQSIEVREEVLIENGTIGINAHDFTNTLKIMKKLLNVRKKVAYLQKKEGKMFPHVSSGMVISLVKPLLDEEEIFYIPTVKQQKLETILQNLNGDQRLKFLSTATIDFTFVDIDSGENLTYSYGGLGFNIGTPEMSVGKLLTYTEKYCLLKSFLISTDEYDADVMAQIVEGSKTTQTISKEDADKIFESFDMIIGASNNELSLQNILERLGKSASDILSLDVEDVTTLQEEIRSFYKEIQKAYGKDGKGSKEANEKNDERVAELVAKGQQQKHDSHVQKAEEDTQSVPSTQVKNNVQEEEPTNNSSQSVQPIQTTTQSSNSNSSSSEKSFIFTDIQKSITYEGEDCLQIRVENLRIHITIIGEESIKLIESFNEGQTFLAKKYPNTHGFDMFTDVTMV
ncbi:hypothetical protein ABD87_22910 [Lysinibacillus sphaericus]|uniref:ERF family protein n=1 Tax=Lysinibacillus sphaericus TaxID=1421 RepID=UPI0018CCF62F|nr:ERF family protein [Lysinibacillus sphaericus]MBG9732279.1 hypothetical protein [Lysinibacillus sphaericus]